VSAALLSFGTLAVVLAMVQVARISVGVARARSLARVGRSTILMLVAFTAGTAARPAQAQASATPATLRARAESTFASGDRAGSARAYAALLDAVPRDARALFRLAGLREEPVAMVPLLERYVAVEPGDAWGWLALADALSRDGQHARAAEAITRAERIAAGERDVKLGRARTLQRAGATDAAIAAYERLVASDPKDADALQSLAEQRRRAGRIRDAIATLDKAQDIRSTPRRAAQMADWKHGARLQLEPVAAYTRDSDGNVTQRGALALRLPLVGKTAFTVGAATLSARNSMESVVEPSSQAAFVNAVWRPRATVHAEATAGVVQVSGPRFDASSTASEENSVPTGLARVRWRALGNGPSLDVRTSRVLLDATPQLLSNRVLRTEAGATLESPVFAGLRVRAMGRSGRITSKAESFNTRTLLGASLVRSLQGWGEIAVNGQRIALTRPTTQGYFAPREAQIAELATYLERESDNGVLLAVDAGVGMQRVQTFEAATPSGWQPAARLWSHLDVPVHRSVLLRTEMDLYDGGVAREAATAAHWRWISASVGLRVTP